MAELIWAEKALGDLEAIHDFIAADSPIYARAQIERLLIAAARLRDFPESGRILPEFPALPYRELLVGAYRCIYRYEAPTATVVVVAVVHGSRLLYGDTMDNQP